MSVGENWHFHKVLWLFQYLVFSLIFALAYGRSWLSHVDEQSIMPINLFNLFDSFWTDPWSLIRWSGDLVILDPVFPGNCMSADNVRCWKIVRKFDNWPRSEASRADVKFWGQSPSQGQYQPTNQRARNSLFILRLYH